MISRKAAFWITCVSLFIILLVYFYPAVFGGKIQGQFDHLYSFHPWKSQAGDDFHDQNPLLSDQALTIIPFYKQLAACLEEKTLPLWNHHSLGGTPLVGNYTASLYYPFYWPFYLTGSEGWLVWIAIFKLLFCGIFTYLFLRIINLSRPVSFLGGMVFMLCGFNILWLFHQHVKVAIFLPCLFYLIELALKSGKKRHFMFLAVAVGVQFLGGHMETSFHVLFAGSLYFLVRLFQLSDLKGQRPAVLGKYLIAMILGTLLASCQLVPFFEYMFHSAMFHQRTAQASPEIFSFSNFSLENLKVFFTLLIRPNLFGSPLTGDFMAPPPLNYNEINGAYIGILPVLLFVASLFLRNKTGIHKFMIFLSLLSMALILQVPVLYPLFKMLPGFSMSNTLRILLILAFSNMVLACFVLNAVLNRIGSMSIRYSLFTVVFVILAVDLFHFGWNYNPTVEKESVYPGTETTDFLKQDPDIFRFSAPLEVFPHETHLPYRITSATGYDALEIRTYTEFMQLLSTHENASYFIYATPYHDKRDSPLFDLLNTRYFITRPGEELDTTGLSLVYEGETKIYRNESCMPRAFLVADLCVEKDKEKRLELLADPAFSPRERVVLEEEVAFTPGSIEGSTVEITDYQANRVEIRVNAPHEAFLVLTDNYFPGWKASINDEPAAILRAYHTFRAVKVPQGESLVTFRYRPWSFYVGICLTLAAAGFIMWHFRTRKTGKSRPERIE